MGDSDGVCDENEVAGCTINTACNYDPSATDDNDSCTYAAQYYDCDGNCLNDTDSDGVCDENEVAGCTINTACNFDSSATDDDNGSCTFAVTGYDCDDFEIEGCTYDKAFNYAPSATNDDNSCIICDNSQACNYDSNPNYSTCDDDSCCYFPGDAQCGLYGDINRDDELNVIDVVLLIQMVLQAVDPEEYYADECTFNSSSPQEICLQAYLRPNLNNDFINDKPNLNVQDVILVIHAVINS